MAHPIPISLTESFTMTPEMKMIAANNVGLYDELIISDMVLRVNKITRHSHAPDKVYFECKHAPTFVDYYLEFNLGDSIEIYTFSNGVSA